MSNIDLSQTALFSTEEEPKKKAKRSKAGRPPVLKGKTDLTTVKLEHDDLNFVRDYAYTYRMTVTEVISNLVKKLKEDYENDPNKQPLQKKRVMMYRK